MPRYIDGLKDGSLKVVTEKTPFVAGSFVGMNSFGFGGSNTHILLKAPEPEKEAAADQKEPQPLKTKLEFPKLVLYAGRTKEGMENVLAQISEHVEDYHLQQLLAYQVSQSSAGQTTYYKICDWFVVERKKGSFCRKLIWSSK